MRPYWILLIIGILGLGYISCTSYKEKDNQKQDTPLRGKITISADESFKPIIDELVKVYESNNRGTQINVEYKPEADCVKDLWNDSIRMVISTIELTKPERQSVVDSLHTVVKQLAVARDAIAVIVSPHSSDSLFNMAEIKEILTGKNAKGLFPVFDGVKATSTVRYIIDSVLKGEKLTEKAVATRTSDSVINYVARTPLAVGFIGVSWIGNQDDREQLSFLKKVKIAHLESNDTPGKYILPLQANLYMKKYPMTRDLVYILKESHKGLGWGLGNFMSGEIGQLIFKRAYLMPGLKSFRLRPIQLNEDEK